MLVLITYEYDSVHKGQRVLCESSTMVNVDEASSILPAFVKYCASIGKTVRPIFGPDGKEIKYDSKLNARVKGGEVVMTSYLPQCGRKTWKQEARLIEFGIPRY